MRKLTMLVLASITTSAIAQTGTYTWELSQDGLSWSNAVYVSSGTLLHVRLLASWAGVSGTSLGFAGGQFDATITGGTSASNVSNITRPIPFAFAAQTLVASTYNGGIKIDTSADLAAPGAGTGWVNPGQPAADFAAASTYNSDNPCVVFSYDYVVGEIATFGMVLNQTTGRAMSVYTTSSGTQVRINASAITVHTATILIPTPTSISLACVSCITIIRRRR